MIIIVFHLFLFTRIWPRCYISTNESEESQVSANVFSSGSNKNVLNFYKPSVSVVCLCDFDIPTCHYLLESQLGIAGGAGEAVDTPGLVKGRHHWKSHRGKRSQKTAADTVQLWSCFHFLHRNINVDVDTAPIIIKPWCFNCYKTKLLTISFNNTIAVVANISEQLSVSAGRETED